LLAADSIIKTAMANIFRQQGLTVLTLEFYFLLHQPNIAFLQ
jgi:hypothetical protein